MQSSSAAGFQLRKHYQKFLLKLECLENNLNANDLIEFAEKQKKKKKEKEKGEPPAAGSAAAGPQTPSSSSSAPTNKDHPEQKQNEKQKTAADQQQSQQKHMPPPPPSANGPPQFAAYPQGKTHVLMLIINFVLSKLQTFKSQNLDLQNKAILNVYKKICFLFMIFLNKTREEF
jgi:hypothetical protein